MVVESRDTLRALFVLAFVVAAPIVSVLWASSALRG
jgi:hypothetical protein